MDIFARFLIAALQTGCNIIPVVAPGFKWPRPDTLPEDVSPICHMNGIKWKFGLQVMTETIKIRSNNRFQHQIIDRLDKFMTGTGSLQTLTNLSRASSIRSVQSSRNGDLVVAAPGGTTPKVSYTRSNSQVISWLVPNMSQFWSVPVLIGSSFD